MNEIIPGILEKEWKDIERKIESVLPFAKTLHIDIIDGKFVDNKTFLDPTPFKKYSDKVTLELHMMVENPLSYLQPWADAGFKRFIGHVEKMPDIAEFIATGQRLGEVGLAFDGPTDLESASVSLLDVDSILIYTSKQVGFSGPPFMEERLLKVKHIRNKDILIPIEVDGGINETTILSAKKAGATRFVSTSYLFKDAQVENRFNELLRLVNTTENGE